MHDFDGKPPSVNLFACALRRYTLMLGLKWLPLSSMRVFVLRLCGVKVGKGCFIGFDLRIDTNYPSFINIGNYVTISHDVSLYAHTATPAKSRLSTHYSIVKPIDVGNGAWIGAGATILPGARIADDSMVGAGAVLSGRTESCGVYAGNPAKLIRRLDLLGQ